MTRRAMTLVEVLVAVVVCGAGVAVVAGGIAAAVRADGHAERLTRAAGNLELLLAQVESQVLPLEDGEGDFSESGGQSDMRWALSVGTTEIEGLVSISATVLWEESGIEHDLSVERLVFIDPLMGGVR